MKRFICVLLALTMIAALPLLAGCQKVDKELPIRVWTLNGTTGFGMAQLIDADKNGKAALNYEFTVESVPANVTAALISGDADIAALPTNAAANLYNKKNDSIVLLALNTQGVLYLVVNTAKVSAPASLADLAGKTVYCPAENPALITKALLDKASMTNVTLDTSSFAAPAALQAAVAAGKVDYAILPEPMVTIAQSKAAEGVTLTAALDITAIWNEYFEEGSLVQGCIVARKAFVDEHPNEVKKFLKEYKESIEFVMENPAEASQMIVDGSNTTTQTPIFAGGAAVAEKAIPKCNLCFVKGKDMKDAMSAYLATMPLEKIGGALPADGFYYDA